MTYQEINGIVEEIATELGCDYGYYSMDSDQTVRAPYLIFVMGSNTDTYADNSNYAEKVRLAIEYDSSDREIESEKIIQEALAEYGLTWGKSTSFVDGQHIHEVMYEMEVYLNE